MCECLTYGHDEYDGTVSKIAGHHPDCPHFAVDKFHFAENLQAEAEIIAGKMFAKELPKLKKMYGPKKPREISERIIQNHLFKFLEKLGHKFIAPNVEMFYTGEMDVCSVSKRKYKKEFFINEYEIKLSRKDFKRDFSNKEKHEVFPKIRRGIFSETREYRSGNGTYEIEFTAPNYFYFVTLTDLLKPEEMPDYAGLVYINPNNLFSVRIVKQAKILHAKPVTDEDRLKIAHKLMWRCWKAREKVEETLEKFYE